MSPRPRQRPATQSETGRLRRQIEDLRAALTAIRAGGVDAVVMAGPLGDRVYVLESADRPYRLIVEEMGEGAATISEQGIILHINPRLAHLLGRDRGALLGTTVDTLVPPDQRRIAADLLSCPTGTTLRAELDLTRADGSRVPVLASVTALTLDDVVLRCLIATDLTQRRQAERQIAEANAALTIKATELEEAQRVAQVGSWVWDRVSDRVTMSTQTASILSRDPANSPVTFVDVFAAPAHPDDTGLLAARDAAVACRSHFEHAYRILRPDGAIRHVLIRGEVLVGGENRAVTGMRGILHDVTPMTEIRQSLDRTTARFVAAFEHTPVGMALVDPGYVILHANRALAVMLQLPKEQVPGRCLAEFLQATDAQERPPPLDDPGADIDRIVPPTEWRLITATGQQRWICLRVALLGEPASQGDALVHVEDITERKSHEAQLSHMATHDQLTSLLNRWGFRDLLEHHAALATRFPNGGAMVLLDLDNFKYVNDTLGHPAGDLLLIAIAGALRQRIRDSDVLARLGGDEFGVLVSGVDLEGARSVTEDLLRTIRGTALQSGSVATRSTASAGIVLLGDPTMTVDDVLANADLAMYAAKRTGGDRSCVFDRAGPIAAASRATLICLDRVRNALEHDRFRLEAQPILCLASNRIEGCELLLRLQEDEKLIPPEEFLDIAQSHGLAQAIDRFVVRRAIGIAARSTMPSGFRWEINLSVDALNDATLPKLIRTELTRQDVDPRSLIFEITETTAISNMEQAQAFAATVGRLGCSFAVDDFGRGYGSFYYLKHLPLNYLKIDGEFIRNLSHSRADQVIVQSVIETAHALGLQTIAEYVHDQETLELLRTLHVDHAQGFHIGGPAPPEALLATIRQHRGLLNQRAFDHP